MLQGIRILSFKAFQPSEERQETLKSNERKTIRETCKMKKALCAQFEVYTRGTSLLYLFYPHDLMQCPSIENAALPFHQRPLDPSS